MNKLRKYFYDKAKKNLENEIDEHGLQIIDEARFHKRVLAASKRDMIYTGILIVLVVWLIMKVIINAAFPDTTGMLIGLE